MEQIIEQLKKKNVRTRLEIAMWLGEAILDLIEDNPARDFDKTVRELLEKKMKEYE